MEDLLNHGSGSEAAPLQSLGISGRVQTAAELCHRMVDFCQRLTTAKRKILEDPDLYPEVSKCSRTIRKMWQAYCDGPAPGGNYKKARHKKILFFAAYEACLA